LSYYFDLSDRIASSASALISGHRSPTKALYPK
jgi:hypothetical protein